MRLLSSQQEKEGKRSVEKQSYENLKAPEIRGLMPFYSGSSVPLRIRLPSRSSTNFLRMENGA